MKPVRTILHPSDFSPASARACAMAVALARQNRARLIVVHVLHPVVPAATEGFVSPGTYAAIVEAGRRDARTRLDAVVARARKAGVRAASLLVDGLPHEQIVRAVRSKRADLVVLGTHGRSGLARLVLGSVAERVIGLARCPVLTVRGRRG
ncbi:MAG TPA: universal stress protein [Methylomirabilota bacterium]|nr:universal stress protein [Methylomirabilota bacterium]